MMEVFLQYCWNFYLCRQDSGSYTPSFGLKEARTVTIGWRERNWKIWVLHLQNQANSTISIILRKERKVMKVLWLCLKVKPSAVRIQMGLGLMTSRSGLSSHASMIICG